MNVMSNGTCSFRSRLTRPIFLWAVVALVTELAVEWLPSQGLYPQLPRPLNLLPCRCTCAAPGLPQPRKRCEPLPRVLNESLAHLLRQHPPPSHKSCRILQVAFPKLVVYNTWQHILQLAEAPRSRQF